ncbi:LysR family transcriptional regulator [Streptomyces sp. 8K308]|uniref:LysR family transcriptional regulator n=1 Tax=Streptomyces sp. 8K308 TaxID=2530388 RepID=UPI001A9E9D10|nr:LysR family transcriptional regulator [Streptomyces sp. 8K308]
MRLSQLRVLLAVADHGGFTVAAERIGVSQPAASRAVAALEAELGAPLLVRGRDGVTLTEAGRRAVRHARAAVHHLDLVRTEVAAAIGQVTGELRLASLPSATGTLVAALLREFTDRHPHVRVRLLEGLDRDVRAWLDRGAAEVGVVTLPAPGLDTLALGSDEMVALLPAGHPLAAAPAVDVTALAGEPFVLSTGGCRPLVLGIAGEAGIELRVAYEAGEVSAIEGMVASGLGVSVVPTLGRERDQDGTVTRPLRPRAHRTLALAFAPGDRSPAVHALRRVITDRGPDAPSGPGRTRGSPGR